MSGKRFILGIDIGGTKTALECRDLAGNTLDRDRIPTGAAHGAQVVLDGIQVRCQHMLNGIDGELVAVGAVSPGVVQDDGILLAPNNPGWDTLSLRSELQERLQAATVVVDNDVKAATLAEARVGSLADVSHGIFLSLGTGLAAAAVIDGVVLRGAHHAATEIAYQLVCRAPAGPEPDGAAPPLESYVSGAAIARRASALLGRNVSTEEALEAGRMQEDLRRMVDDAFDTLGAHLANLAIVIDPDRIVVGGGMVAQHARFFPHLTAVLNSAVPFPPELVVSRFAQSGPLLGALLLAGDVAAPSENTGRWAR